MNGPPVHSWLERLLGACLILLVSAWALSTAYRLIKPLIPAAVVLTIIGVLVAAGVRAAARRREFW